MRIENRPGTVDDLTRLYRESIKRHASEPVGYGEKIDATHQHEEYNPLCGDRIRIMLRIADKRIESVAFKGEACAICMASSSLLCEHSRGRTIEALTRLHDDLQAALGDGDGLQLAEALKPLLGVKPYPSRIRCATLPWTAALKSLTAVQL